ncbi:hypothetical protein AAMO2058_000479700 [Amorphochlora amoebiformis]
MGGEWGQVCDFKFGDSRNWWRSGRWASNHIHPIAVMAPRAVRRGGDGSVGYVSLQNEPGA